MKVDLRSIIAFSFFLVVLEGIVSYFVEKNFLPSQVFARWGRNGIPLVAHGGFWGDLFILPPVFWYVVTRYGEGWSQRQIVVMVGIGFAITLANHINLMMNQTLPDPFGWKEERWSTLIALHFVYMTMYVALSGLFFFSSGKVPSTLAVLVGVALGLHMMLGTHVILGIVKRWTQWSWCPDFFANPQMPYVIIGIWVIVAILASIGAGWKAGVTIVGIVFGFLVGRFIVTKLLSDW